MDVEVMDARKKKMIKIKKKGTIKKSKMKKSCKTKRGGKKESHK